MVRRLRARWGVLLVAGILAGALAGPLTGAADAARPKAPGGPKAPSGPKVVIIVGPVGWLDEHYRGDGDAIAAEARRYTDNVVELATPRAPWSKVQVAAQGANILVYLGHGNGWPSPYAPFQTLSKDGLGLDPEDGADGTRVAYVGEGPLAAGLRLAPHAVVLLYHLCYASGNSEPGVREGSLATARARVDNFAAGFIAAGASAVFAEGHPEHPVTSYIDQLLTTRLSMAAIFRASPTFAGHVLGSYASVRSPGRRYMLDPEHTSHGFYRSVAGNLALTADLVRRGAGRPSKPSKPPKPSRKPDRTPTPGVSSALHAATLNRKAFYPQDRDILLATTTLTYRVAKASSVRVVVLDPAGRTIRTLAAGRQAAGLYHVKWDGRSRQGAIVPQARYRIAVLAAANGRVSRMTRDVRVFAFTVTTSAGAARRGHTIALRAVSTEPVSGPVRVVVRQPGIAAWSVTLRHITGRTYAGSVTLRKGGTAGTVLLSVTARDVNGGTNTTVETLPLR